MSGLKSTLITAVLAAAVGAAAAWGAMTMQARQDTPADLHQLVHERLDLSPEQDRRLEAIEAAFEERRAPLEAEVRAANAELSAAIAADSSALAALTSASKGARRSSKAASIASRRRSCSGLRSSRS